MAKYVDIRAIDRFTKSKLRFGGGLRKPGAFVAALSIAGLSFQMLTPIAHAAELPGSTVRSDFAFAEQQLASMTTKFSNTAYPVRTSSTGAWVTAGASDWTSGFFPGSLWQMYERTNDPIWKTRAQNWTAGLEGQKFDNSSHDVGFQIFNSFGQGYKLTGDESYKQVVLTAANTLASRYNPTVGAFRSWDAVNDTSQYQVIIDNLMNLELMYWAAANGGDPAWKDMATSHALVTARDHLRTDGGSWHVVNYNQTTGAVQSKYTHQGDSDDSTWSRGQAWAVYGYAMAYRYTQDTRFLDAARKTADYFISNLPADKVPYWDFNLTSLNGQPRDSSAAAIASAGLLELIQYEPDQTRHDTYYNNARDMLASLSSTAYLAKGTTNQAILLHGTQNKPNNNYDTGLVFGDYYFIEALKRYDQAVAGTNAPVAAFSANNTSVGSGSAVNFTDESANNPTAWQWNFGDPNSGASNVSDLRNPSHTYSTPGTYDVTLTVTNANGTDTMAKVGYVVVVPGFTLSASPTSRSISRGATTTYNLTVASEAGFSSPVSLGVTGLPANVTATFSANPTTTTSVMTVKTTNKAPRGTFTLNVVGTGGGVTKTLPVTLVIR